MSTAGSADMPRFDERGHAVGNDRLGRRVRRFGRARFAAVATALCATVAAAFGSLVWSAPPAAAAGPTITGSGSSYAAVAIDNWVAEVEAINGDSINYQTSSSVTGLDEFAEQQVDFGASEIGYSTNQAQDTPPAGYAYQYLPDVAGATCLMYNVANPITGQQFSGLQLTTSMLLGILTGTITKWGQLATGGLNEVLAGDNNPIVVVFRTDASGDNYIMSDYLDTLDPSAWNAYTSALAFPSGPQAIWPFPQGNTNHPGYDFSNWNGETGSDNASNYVYANSGSITYVETAYALEHHDPCAAVQNIPGHAFVQPSALSDAYALLHAQLLPDLEQLLTGVFTVDDPRAYPISAYSYLVTQEGQMDPAKGAVLGRFIQFFACQGQQSAQQLGYSPLPPNLVNDDFAAISRIAGAAKPPATVNATTCNDPYVALFDGNVPPQPVPGGGPGTGGGSGTTSSVAGAAAANGAGSGAAGTVGAAGAGSGAAGTGAAGASADGIVNGVLPDGEPVGLVLARTEHGFLHSLFPFGSMWAWTFGLLLLVAVPPTVAVVRRRRARPNQVPGEPQSQGAL